MGIKEIYECYDFLQIEIKKNKNIDDFLIALEIMIVSHIEEFVKLVIYDIKEINEKAIKVLDFALNNFKDKTLQRFINKLCMRLISGNFNAKEKIDILIRLRNIDVFISNLGNVDCWSYDNPKKNEKSFLGMIIRELTFFEPTLFQKFLKKKKLKNKVVSWLYNVLKQNETRTIIENASPNTYCSDKFMLDVSNEIIKLYWNGKNASRMITLDINLIYTDTYLLNFAQEESAKPTQEDQANQVDKPGKRNLFNEYFFMAIKSIQLGFISLIVKYNTKIGEIKKIRNTIDNYNQMCLENTMLTGLLEIRIKIFKTKEIKLKRETDAIRMIIENKSICDSNLKVLCDLLYMNRENIHLLTDQMIENVINVMTKSLYCHIYIDTDIIGIFKNVISSTYFNYHTKIKVIDLLLTYDNLNMNFDPCCLDIEYIIILHKFYLEIGSNNIDEYYKYRTRRIILCLIRNFIDDKHNYGLYIDEFKDKSSYIKFIHNTISDLASIVTKALDKVEQFKNTDAQLQQLQQLPQEQYTQQELIQSRDNNVIAIESIGYCIKRYIYFIDTLSEYDMDIFRNKLVVGAFSTTITYLLNSVFEINKYNTRCSNNSKLYLLMILGNIIHKSINNDCILTHLMADRYDIIELCERIIKIFFTNKDFNLTSVSRLIYNLDSDIEQMKRYKTQKQSQEQEQAQNKNRAEIEEPPENFIDPIMMCIMANPVELPSSNVVLNKDTILQQLLHSEEDPYSREKLTTGLLEDHNNKTEVKEKMNKLKIDIEKWLSYELF